MPVKLILFIFMLMVVGAFIGFNAGFTSDIAIWPSEKGTFTDVPILLSFFVMYMVGVLSVIPFFIGKRYGKDKKKKTVNTTKEKKKAGSSDVSSKT
ncbi:hypothetical protein S1OALGB6SA_1614 [Olavius algarvensis spirochete endosymbiont]|uniref:hypothetical protein n=1 Tax=Olavius algarvensis spirochete endosymbiont TaxID=260710 RepID=UPI00052DC782|nr:hypothetical protein [Olavius algarvensis spirochete endosymbiont]KGM42915.1 hypothetical protein JY97_10715 [Alkalispirochaeta odontotermitis]VDB00532.1 hypothetical protein S1OALGB6SA_1614 [Olavius algarvensis spirochete endosymbiont]